MKMRHLFIMLAAVWSTLGMISLANAEGPIEEVIVTAERRAESLQSVAVAVTAFTGEEMDAQGIVDIKGITERTPGFTMGTFNPGQPQFYIRGIGSNEDGAGGDQSVIVFVDEVYIGRSAGSDFDLFDLERVEVLRGPQGTLFGKNVIGGAVSLVTKKPTEETRMKFEGTAGNLGEVGVRGLVSGELAENVYGKVSISSRRRDGYVDSRIDEFPEFFPDTNVDDQHDINTDSLRAALRMTPSDRLEINLSANWSQMDRAGPTYISIGPGGIPYGANASLDPNYGANIHENFIEDPGSSETDISGFTARFDYELTDSTSFTSLTSFRSVESEQIWALSTPNLSALFVSGGAIPLYLVGNNNYTDESDTFTHEFRLTGGNDKLFWIAGLYYMTEETDRFETSSVGLLFPGGGGVPGNLPGIVPGDDQGNETTSYSVFGQFTYNITDALAITLGGRQSFDKKDITRVGTPSPLSPNRNFDFRTSNDWDAFTGKFTVEWQATENAFLYGTISEGYKAGGYQGLAATELIAITPFDPEEATLYEIGAKTEWFDNRLRLNLAVFQTDYSDLQILQLLVEEDAPFGTGGQLITQNAADADIEGYELEFVIAPTDNLTISGSYTHLDTAFSNFFTPTGFRPPDGGAGTGGDRTGNPLRNAPDKAYNVLVRYYMGLSNGGSLTWQADFRHKDIVYQDPDVFEFAAVPEYDVVDLRVSYVWPKGNLETTLWSRNANDESYFLHNWPLQGSGQATPAPPRTYGVTFTWTND